MRCALLPELPGKGVVVGRGEGVCWEPPAAITTVLMDGPRENRKHPKEKKANREKRMADVNTMSTPHPASPPIQPCRVFPGLFRSFFLLQPSWSWVSFPGKKRKEKKDSYLTYSLFSSFCFLDFQILQSEQADLSLVCQDHRQLLAGAGQGDALVTRRRACLPRMEMIKR